MNMIGVTIEKINIYFFRAGILTNMLEKFCSNFFSENFFAVFSSPDSVYPNFYERHELSQG